MHLKTVSNFICSFCRVVAGYHEAVYKRRYCEKVRASHLTASGLPACEGKFRAHGTNDCMHGGGALSSTNDSRVHAPETGSSLLGAGATVDAPCTCWRGGRVRGGRVRDASAICVVRMHQDGIWSWPVTCPTLTLATGKTVLIAEGRIGALQTNTRVHCQRRHLAVALAHSKPHHTPSSTVHALPKSAANCGNCGSNNMTEDDDG